MHIKFLNLSQLASDKHTVKAYLASSPARYCL